MYQSIMMEIKNSVSEDWIVKTIVEHGIKIFECYFRRKKKYRKMEIVIFCRELIFTFGRISAKTIRLIQV